MTVSHKREPEKPQAAACVACSKAKRRCGRELPSCRRCRIRKAPCSYPTRVVLSRASLTETLTPPVDQSSSDLSPAFDDQTLLLGVTTLPALPSNDDPNWHYSQTALPWFLEPQSWDPMLSVMTEDGRLTYPVSGIEFFLDKLREWINKWALENHCPFIHHRLYGAELPNPLEFALGTWNTYHSSANSTGTKIALKMARDWSQNLVEGQSLSESFDNGSTDLTSHLARTQALLIFQIICLFDGDIQSRVHGEAFLTTLISWAALLIQKAKEDAATDQPIDPGELLNESQITRLHSNGTTTSSWKAYILSESIRRTWVITVLTDAAYWILKNGSSVCRGSLTITARRGVWDALSPREWVAAFESASTIKRVVNCQHLDTVILGAKPLDVDEIGLALFAYGRGQEALNDWLNA
ncbi:hypothetical protein FOMG_19111 [Fusarium oxysporum f. sp. melonis 26406]|uniref:Zn(2)-C6 fungal-type domain-containing protein n=1 Tax=Fusarium oxysporum f. sp. melonis 26406 TaxID=1089452 RepID=W9YYC7_FUSOX|nr:hypothetical protein FOMG_19111 [Fusarium oxysporum f. sp. melonis 26406]